MYEPELPLLSVIARFVSRFVSVTLAFGTAALLGSVTTPPISPNRSWAHKPKQRPNMANRLRTTIPGRIVDFICLLSRHIHLADVRASTYQTKSSAACKEHIAS